MGKIIPLDLGLQSNPGRYGPDTGARLINAYAEQSDPKGKTPYPIFAFEGLDAFATLTGGSRTRGAISLNAYGYVVSGPILFKVDSAGTNTVIGGFPGSGPTFMARNRKNPNPQIALVCDGLRYLCEGDVLSVIADTDLPAANSVCSISGYFIWTCEDGRWFISAIDEGTTIDSLDFESAEANPDNLLVAYARGREAILGGSDSLEFWALTGAAAFPFEQVPGTTIQHLGVLCRHSMKDLNDVVIFVASDGTVRMLDGYTPVRISTHAVERSIASVSDKDSITATAYRIRGHQFYTISAPTFSWTYDGLTRLWFERQSYAMTRWRGEVFVDINGVQVIGDSSTGALYKINSDTYDEAGNHLVWTIRTPPTQAYPNRLIVDGLYLDTIPGTGLNSTDTALEDPEVVVRVSRDSGVTWGSERREEVGKIGETSRRVTFDSFGESGEDGFVFEISMSAAVVRGITAAAIDAELIDP